MTKAGSHAKKRLDRPNTAPVGVAPLKRSHATGHQVRGPLLKSLVELRHRSELSQEQLAGRMHTSQSIVARMESGVTDPRLSSLERYAQALGVDIDVAPNLAFASGPDPNVRKPATGCAASHGVPIKRPISGQKRLRRSFSDKFKADVAEMVRTGLKSVPEVCRDLDLTETAVRLWVAQADIEEPINDGLTTEERAELAQLRKEVRVLRQEREVLKQAAALFARELR